MVEQKKLLIYIGSAFVLALVIVGITLAIVLTGKDDANPDPELTPVPTPSPSKDPRKKLVIDHDGGADDAFAIIMALLYEKYFDGPKVVALTNVFGNVHSSQAFFNSDRILTLCGRQDIPFYDGAHEPLISGIINDYYFGNDGLGDTDYRPPEIISDGKPAAVALIELAKQYRDELIIVATGPLTNIALATRAEPSFMNSLYRLYIGAGHIHSNLHPTPEFNAAMDPEAYYIATSHSRLVNVTYVPFSQVHKSLNISLDWRTETFGKIQSPLVAALNSFERISLTKAPSWAQLDPATMAVALNESLVNEFRNSSSSIGLEGVHRGITTTNFGTSYNGRTVIEANIEKYKEFLLKVFSAGPLP